MTEDIRQREREMADLIRRFMDGTASQYEWDDFMGIPFRDSRLEQARIEAERILEASLSGSKSHADETAELLEIVNQLESGV